MTARAEQLTEEPVGMPRSAADVAQDLRDVASDRVRFQETLAGLFAHTVELRHGIGSDGDGMVSGALLADLSRREVAAVERAVPEASSEAQIELDGDRIRILSRTTGRLSDGSLIDVSTATTLTVTGGAVVALHAEMDEADMAAWATVLAAGGFDISQSVPPEHH